MNNDKRMHDNILFIYLQILNYIYRNYNLVECKHEERRSSFKWFYSYFNILNCYELKFEHKENSKDYIFISIKIPTGKFDVNVGIKQQQEEYKYKPLEIKLLESKYMSKSVMIYFDAIAEKEEREEHRANWIINPRPIYKENVANYIKYLINNDPIFYKEYLVYYDYFNFITSDEE